MKKLIVLFTLVCLSPLAQAQVTFIPSTTGNNPVTTTTPVATVTPAPTTVTVTTPKYALVFIVTIPTGEQFDAISVSPDGLTQYLITNKSVYKIVQQ